MRVRFDDLLPIGGTLMQTLEALPTIPTMLTVDR